MTLHPFAGLDTPRLILDRDRLTANAERMQEHCRGLGIALRPHVKTSKSVDVAKIAIDAAEPRITVSTIKEAEHFAVAGHRDILYATTLVPAKVARIARLQRETGAVVHVGVDSPAVVAALSEAAEQANATLSVLIEIDCGEHRSGLREGSRDIVELASAVHRAPALTLAGVMTHAGHSYSTNDHASVARLAMHERDVAAEGGRALAAAGLPCPIISIGSTPTLLLADHLNGVTEARAGIYMFWDLAQFSRNMCGLDQIAVSVLASVIGHNRWGRSLVLDAGALALSKDIGAQKFLPNAGYGYLCDVATMELLGSLAVTSVHQEHANVAVSDNLWFERLPIGSLVRILPNHACMTCAAYDSYEVVSGGAVETRWPRINGW